LIDFFIPNFDQNKIKDIQKFPFNFSAVITGRPECN